MSCKLSVSGNSLKYSMKKALSILLFTCFSLATYAQKNVAATQKITYVGYIDLNTTTHQELDRENIILINDDKAASWMVLAANYKPINNDSNITVVPKNKMFSAVYKDYKNGKMIFDYSSMFLSNKNHFYTDVLTPMEWVITNRTKTIDGMQCLKALTIFRGRAYSAWFNSNIAISEGPWKFGGLPGLIIELYDEDRHMYWKMKELTLSSEAIPLMPESTTDFATMKKEFNSAYKKYIAANKSEQSVDPSCATCSSSMEVKVKTIENLVE